MHEKSLIQTFFLRYWRIELVLIGMLFVLVGCNLPVLRPPPVAEGPSTCTPEELTSPPRILTPEDGEVVDSLLPTFIWDWPAACNPEEFLVDVFNATGASPAISSWRVAGHSRGSVMRGELQPATTYLLRVTPSTMGSGSVFYQGTFVTGPLCMDVLSPADYPAPILLAPPDGTVYSEYILGHVDGDEYSTISFYMVWDDPSRCNPSSYQVQVSTSPTFPDGRTQNLGPDHDFIQTTMFFYFPPGPSGNLPLQDCTRYYWHVRAAFSDDGYAPYEYGPYSDIWSFEINTGSLMCTTIPIVSPVSPLIPPPTAPPMASAQQNTNCRSGPSRVYEIDSTFFEGQSTPIQGRNADNTWWLIQDPLGGKDCWVWDGSVEVSGDLSAVLVVQSPPTPKPSRPEQTGKSGCWIYNPNLQKNICAVPCPPNAQPGGACNP